MRNLFIILILAFGGYKTYETFFQHTVSAYDEAGNPQTLVFTFNNCSPCNNVIKLLRDRHIEFTEYNVSVDPANSELMKSLGGSRQFPYTVSGNRTITGDDRDYLVGAIAETYGLEVLTGTERRLLRKHFDDAGLPRVVMYMTEHCGYCKQAGAYLDEKGIAYVERDIDKNAAAKRDYDALNGGGTPLIYVGFRRVPGFDKKRLSDALEVL